MNIVVCIKQVPDVTNAIGTGRMVLNAYDASALEAALILTEGTPRSIHLLCVGPESAAETVRKALAMGATEATHIVVPDAQGLDSMAVARILASQISDMSFELIACGKQAQDTDAGLTGGMLAELLQVPYVTNAVGLVEGDDGLVVTRQGDEGREQIWLPMPCLVTCSNDMNDPRIPSLRGIMEAKRKQITETALQEVVAPETRVIELLDVPTRKRGTMLTGDATEMVSALCVVLSEETGLL